MIVKNAISPIDLWKYLERYVNKGSPSGFGGLDARYNVKEIYNPLSDYDGFDLFYVDEKSDTLGDVKHLSGEDSIELYLHPQMVDEGLDKENHFEVKRSKLFAVPTSSSRTVFTDKCFVKLHYDGKIGRVDRKILRKHALSSIELTQRLQTAIDEKKLPDIFSFLREPVAKNAKLNSGYELSCVFRELLPYSANKGIKWIVPMFSLFSADKNAPSDKYILEQLVSNKKASPFDYILSVIKAVIECYFEIIINCGLQFECQAQNVLLGFGEKWDLVSVIFRDLESVDKDISLIEELGCGSSKFDSYPYKCMWRGYHPQDGDDAWQKKHSFMYDFKLGEYIFEEMIKLGVEKYSLKKEDFYVAIKKYVKPFLARLPVDFFPPDKWWFYKNVVLDREEDKSGIRASKPYEFNTNLKFR